MAQTDPEDDSWPIQVLVVEDEPILRALLADVLREAGFTVAEAANGQEALAYFRLKQDLDLVFTDIQMPGLIDGIALVRELRALEPSLPIIVTSGAVGPENIDGDTSFIPKPYRLDAACALVLSTLGIRPKGTE